MYEHKKMKTTLGSEDGGETWYVSRIFYVSESETSYSKYQMEDSKPYEDMVLERIDQK